MLGDPNIYQSLGAFLGKAGKVMGKRLSENFAEAGYDINLEHWILLVHLWAQDGLNQKALCNFAGQHKTHITRTITSLEKLGFVVRIPDKSDKRNKLIYLTRQGKEVREGLLEQMQKTMGEATKDIDPQDILICKQVLGKVFLNLADEDHLKFMDTNSYDRNEIDNNNKNN